MSLLNTALLPSCSKPLSFHTGIIAIASRPPSLCPPSVYSQHSQQSDLLKITSKPSHGFPVTQAENKVFTMAHKALHILVPGYQLT